VAERKPARAARVERPAPDAVKGGPLAELCAQNRRLQALLAARELVTTLALNGATAQDIAAELSDLCGCAVRILDPLLREIEPESAHLFGEPAWPARPGFLRLAFAGILSRSGPLQFRQRRGRGDDVLHTIAPIVANEITLGYLALSPSRHAGRDLPDDESLLAIADWAAVACSIPMGGDHLRGEVREEARKAYLRRLIEDDIDSATARVYARSLGLGRDVQHRALVFLPLVAGAAGAPRPLEGPLQRRALDVIRLLIQDSLPQAPVHVRDDHVVALVCDQAGRAASLGKQVTECAKKLFDGIEVAAGVGSIWMDAADAPRSYDEALKACEVGLTFGNLRQQAVLSYDRVGFYGLLARANNAVELGSFVDTALGPLVEYDRKKKPTLMATLRAFLANHGSLVRTCQELHIQPSTLTYRLQRIKNVSRLDLYSTDDVLVAQAALLIHDGGINIAARAIQRPPMARQQSNQRRPLRWPGVPAT
jgi:hypothetical protein